MRATDSTNRSPRLDAVTRDLGVLRTRGLARASTLDIPALAHCVAAVAGREPSDLDTHHYEIALTNAIDEMGDGDAAETAAVLFGVAPHVRGLHPIELRKRAAEATYDRPPEASTVDAFARPTNPGCSPPSPAPS